MSAVVQPIAHRQRAGRCRVTRRAERVVRPVRANRRRRSVLVVTIPAPRPIRAVQRARLWAMTWTASQAPLAANVQISRRGGTSGQSVGREDDEEDTDAPEDEAGETSRTDNHKRVLWA